MNKKVNFGGQTTIMIDSRQFHPSVIIHWHKLHPNLGMTRRETIELKYLFLDVEQILIEDEHDVALATQNARSSKKKIFRNKPTVTTDNFFFYDKMLDWIAWRH